MDSKFKMEEMDRANNIKPHFFRNQAKKQNKQQKKRHSAKNPERHSRLSQVYRICEEVGTSRRNSCLQDGSGYVH